MEKEFALLMGALEKFKDLKIIESNIEEAWIQFTCDKQTVSAIVYQIVELQEFYEISFVTLGEDDDSEDISYEIILPTKKTQTAIKVLTKKLLNLHKSNLNIKKAEKIESGLPDLSLVTIKQMTSELKTRDNLVFALIWVENNDKDNIAIEGSGNPTQLIGLLARGTHMAIEWADKNIKFYRPPEEK